MGVSRPPAICGRWVCPLPGIDCRLPRSGERGESVALPTDFPVAFIDIVRRCLSRNPAQRPSVADFHGWLKRGSAEPDVATPPPPAAGSAAAAAAVAKPSTRRLNTTRHPCGVELPEPALRPRLLSGESFEYRSWRWSSLWRLVGLVCVGSREIQLSTPTTEVASTTAPPGASPPGETAGDSAQGPGGASPIAADSSASATSDAPAAGPAGVVVFLLVWHLPLRRAGPLRLLPRPRADHPRGPSRRIPTSFTKSSPTYPFVLAKPFTAT